MKIKFSFISFLILLIFYVNGFSDNKDVTNDMFGLEMKVIAPFPDVKNDGIEMDTVRYGHIISVQMKYKNLTDVIQRDFEISAFFPNRFESYTTLISWNRRPDYADHPDSSIQATWKFGDLAPLDSGKIEFSLVADRAPKDTIYLSYEAVARANWTPVSQISHTNSMFLEMESRHIPIYISKKSMTRVKFFLVIPSYTQFASVILEKLAVFQPKELQFLTLYQPTLIS